MCLFRCRALTGPQAPSPVGFFTLKSVLVSAPTVPPAWPPNAVQNESALPSVSVASAYVPPFGGSSDSAAPLPRALTMKTPAGVFLTISVRRPVEAAPSRNL